MTTSASQDSTLQNRYIPLDVKRLRNKKRAAKGLDAYQEKSNDLKNFKTIILERFKSPIASITFNPVPSEYTARVFVTGSTCVDSFTVRQFLSEKGKVKSTATLYKSYTRFKNYVRCSVCRADGRVVASGDDNGVVHIFDTQYYSQLRRLKGHVGSVKSCCFSVNKLNYLLTGGDDTSLRLWDISDGTCVVSVPQAHSDSIHSLASGSSFSAETLLFASGSYDMLVKLWSFAMTSMSKSSLTDSKTSDGTTEDSASYNVIASFHHGHPVESVIFFKKNSILISAGGPEIKLWNVCGSGSLIHCIRSHVKTVTALDVSSDDLYIISGSLDGTVKFHCPSTFTLLHSISYNEPVTSICLFSPNHGGTCLAIALSDGQWSIRQRMVATQKKTNKKSKVIETNQADLRHDTTRFFKRGVDASPDEGDIVVDGILGKRSCWLDRLIQGFYHQKSLEEIIRKGPADAVIALIETLIEQNVLHIAVRGKDEESIPSLLNFVQQQLGRNELCTSLLLEFTHTLLAENPWLYSTTDKTVIQSLERISNKLELDVSQHQILRELTGILDIMENFANDD